VLGPQLLRLAGDYAAESPLWSSVDGRMVNLEELPICDETRSLLAAWALRWEELAAPGVLTDEPEPDAAARERLTADAEALRERLQAELGPPWSVTTVLPGAAGPP
jgi:hypothetical protein